MSGPRADGRFNLVQVAVRAVFSCALTALLGFAIFLVIRYVAGPT
jgi:hypothetical protein